MSSSDASSSSQKLQQTARFLQTEQVSSDEKNLKDVVCTRCGSVVLRKNMANFLTEKQFELPLMYRKKERTGQEDQNEFKCEHISRWWSVSDMFAFENVGFTHSFRGQKFLACADCEVGPIGVVDADTNPNRFLIAVDRVTHN